MVQVQLRLLSRDPLRAAQISSLQLNFSAPLVDQATAEIWPVRGLEPGREHDFTLYWQPRFSASDPGFDHISLGSSASAPLQLVSVHSGSDLALRLGAGRPLWPGELEMSQPEPSLLKLAFPSVVRGGETVYAIRFRTRNFLNSTVFSLSLANSLWPGILQVASEGDVGTASASQSLVVIADLRETSLLTDQAVAPRIFTPNGDGINDVVQIRFVVFKVETVARVRIFDLAGREVAELVGAVGETATYEWTGGDIQGQMAPPGIYLCHIDLGASSGQGVVVRPVALVY
jgi:hypothetical protein